MYMYIKHVGYSELIIFHIELHSSSTLFLVAKSLFQGMAGLPNFVSIQRPGLGHQNR